MAIHRFTFTLLLVVLSITSLPAAGLAAEQPAQPEPRPDPRPAATVDPEALPVSVERIRQGLEREPALRIPADGIPRFYVEVEAEFPRLMAEFIDRITRDLVPVPHGSMVHREFLAMVTPPELYSTALVPARDRLIVGLQSALMNWLLKKSAQKVGERDERERRKIQEEIDYVLRQLEGGRQP